MSDLKEKIVILMDNKNLESLEDDEHIITYDSRDSMTISGEIIFKKDNNTREPFRYDLYSNRLEIGR